MVDEACPYDTKFTTSREMYTKDTYLRAECSDGMCGFVSIEKLSTEKAALNFSQLAELHIAHLIYSRDAAAGEDAGPICKRCGHEDWQHWQPGSTLNHTACIPCMDKKITTEWKDSGGTTRTGICDHIAEWVREPW